jgi:hypothetical protein
MKISPDPSCLPVWQGKDSQRGGIPTFRKWRAGRIGGGEILSMFE